MGQTSKSTVDKDRHGKQPADENEQFSSKERHLQDNATTATKDQLRGDDFEYDGEEQGLSQADNEQRKR